MEERYAKGYTTWFPSELYLTANMAKITPKQKTMNRIKQARFYNGLIFVIIKELNTDHTYEITSGQGKK